MRASFLRRGRRILATTIVVGAAGGLSVLGYAATASADSGESGPAQHWSTTSTNVVTQAPFCSPPTRCVVSFTNTSTWAGDVNATQVQAGAGVLLPGGVMAESTATSWVTGTVLGCPSAGQFALTWDSLINLVTGTGTAHATVVAGSGSGGLTTLRGTLVGVITRGPDGKAHTDYTGHLRCGDDD